MSKEVPTIARTPEMWLVAYYLARFGRPRAGKSPLPPIDLGTNSWADAYERFFPALGAGRTTDAFRNSLKNARDVFDAHVGSGRVGWRDATNDARPPGQLVSEAARVLATWGEASHQKVWAQIALFAGVDGAPITPTSVVAPSEGDEQPDTDVPLANLRLEDVLVDIPRPAPPGTQVGGGPIGAYDDSARKALGLAGEKWVVELERERLKSAGRSDLAIRVTHSSIVQGDGLGYDILSYDVDGKELYIEVKTTRQAVRADFMLTANELRTSEQLGKRYRLFRVFNWGKQPGVYVMYGPLSPKLNLTPQVWRAHPNGQ